MHKSYHLLSQSNFVRAAKKFLMKSESWKPLLFQQECKSGNRTKNFDLLFHKKFLMNLLLHKNQQSKQSRKKKKNLHIHENLFTMLLLHKNQPLKQSKLEIKRLLFHKNLSTTMFLHKKNHLRQNNRRSNGFKKRMFKKHLKQLTLNLNI